MAVSGTSWVLMMWNGVISCLLSASKRCKSSLQASTLHSLSSGVSCHGTYLTDTLWNLSTKWIMGCAEPWLMFRFAAISSIAGVFNLLSSRANLHLSYNPAGRSHCSVQYHHGHIKHHRGMGGSPGDVGEVPMCRWNKERAVEWAVT